MVSKNLFKSVDLSLINKRNKLNYIENIINSYNPESVMKKGYSIVYKKNKVIKDTINLSSDELFKTSFLDTLNENTILEELLISFEKVQNLNEGKSFIF